MTSLLSFFFVIAPFWCLLACTGRAALDFDNGKITKTLGIPTVGALTTAAVYADHQNRGLQGSVEQTAFEVWKKITSLPNKMFLAEVDPTSGPFDKKTVIHIKGIGFSTALDELQKFLEAKSFQFKKPDSQHRDDIQNEIAPKDPYGEVLLSPSVTSPPQFFTRSIKSISDPAQNRTQPAVRFVSSLLEPQVYIHIRIIDGPYYVISARAISDTEVVGSFVPPSSAIGGNKVDAVPRTLSILSTTKPFQRTAQSHLSSLLTWVKQSRRSRSPAGVMGELRDFQRSAGSTFAWAFLSVEYFPYPLSKQQNAAVFRLYPVPVITEVLPRTLSLTGGEPLYLFGSNFFVSDKTQVKLYANTTKSDAEVRLRILDCELVMMRPPSVAINVTQTFTQKPERSEEVAAILCESPPWPVEEAVRIALSFNGQIYHDCIESEKSLGGYFKKTNDLRGYHDPMTLQYLDPQSLLGAAAKSVIERPKDIGLHKDAHNPHLISNVYNMSTLHARNESVAPKPILAFSVSKASNSDSNKQNILSDTLSPGTSAGTANLQKVSIVNQSAIENIVTHAEVSVKAVLGTEDGSTQAISSLDALQAPSREPADVKEIKLQQPATESQSVLASPRRLPRYSKKIADPLSIYLEDTQGNAYVLSRPFDTQQIRPDSRLLNDFMLMVCATAIGAIISETIRIPVFLGHLVGGLVIGPHYLNGVQQLVQISSIAQLGSAFLLFELGLHFSLSKIAKVARAAFFGGILAQVSFFVLFSQLAWLRQTSVTEGLIIGSFLSMSSTILCSRDIASRNAKEDAESSMSIGILLVQDLLLGVDLALMPLLRISSGGSANVFEVISKLVAPVLQACVLLIVTFILGCGIIPRLLPYIQQTKSPETFFLLCVMVIVGMGALSERLNLSFELGAFSGGLSMSYVRPHIHHAIAAVLEALKGFWGSLFFASIGLILDPFFMWDNLYEVLLVLVTFVTIKFLVLFFLLKCSKHGFFLSVRVALMLSHLGEFGFVILEKAVRYNLLTRKVHLLLLGSIGISLITTPFFLKLLACLPSEGEIDPSLTHQSTKPIEEKNHGSIFQKTWYSNILYGVAKVFHYRPHGTVLNSAYEHVKVETPDNYEPQHSTSHVVDIIVSQHQSSNAPNEEVQWIPSTETKHIAYETLPPAFTTVWPTVNEEQCPELPHTSNNSGSFELCTCEASRHRESSVKGKLQEIDRQAE